MLFAEEEAEMTADKRAADAVQLVIEMFCDEDVSYESVADELRLEGLPGVAAQLRAKAES